MQEDGVTTGYRISEHCDVREPWNEFPQDLQAFAADHPHQLLERYAQGIADLLMSEFGAPWAKVRVAKLAPIAGVKELGIVIERGRA